MIINDAMPPPFPLGKHAPPPLPSAGLHKGFVANQPKLLVFPGGCAAIPHSVVSGQPLLIRSSLQRGDLGLPWGRVSTIEQGNADYAIQKFVADGKDHQGAFLMGRTRMQAAAEITARDRTAP
jgi:hypothetical protein